MASHANAPGHPWQAPNSKYLFQILNEDGSIATWHVYWDDIYAVRWRHRLCLAASRYVPHNDFLFALYLAHKYGKAPVHHAAFPELPRSPGGPDPAKGAVELMTLDPPSLVPPEMLREATRTLKETIDLTIAQQVAWLAPYLPQRTQPLTFNDVVAMGPFGLPPHIFPQPELALGSNLGGLTGTDPRVFLSFEIDRAIKDRLAAISEQQSRGYDASGTLAVYHNLESELQKRLYSDPQYLTLVNWVMAAQGAFVSPMVQDFLTFYFQCLKERIGILAERGEFDPTFWEERLLSALAKAEANAEAALPYHLITLLGFVEQGAIHADPCSPHGHERVFPIDPHTDLSTLRLSRMSAWSKRGMEILIRTCLVGNVEDVRCLGE